MAKTGLANVSNKLTPQRVQQIRDAVRLGWSQHSVAAHFRVSQATVSNIVNRRLWAHLPDVHAAPLSPLSFALVDPELRTHGGRFAGPGGVVDLAPSPDMRGHADDAASSSTDPETEAA